MYMTEKILNFWNTYGLSVAFTLLFIIGFFGGILVGLNSL